MQYLTFYLKNEIYGIPLTILNEIIKYQRPTALPESAYYIEGIINLRENVIPIIDLRERFNLKTDIEDNKTKIIIITIQDKLIGLKVDSVSEVININIDEIDCKSQNEFLINKDFIKGIAKHNDKLIILLDIELLLRNIFKLVIKALA